MKKIKEVYQLQIFINWSYIMVDFYVEVNHEYQETYIKIIQDYWYEYVYQNYDDIFNTSKWYKECRELHSIIKDKVKQEWLDIYPIESIEEYKNKVTVHIWY